MKSENPATNNKLPLKILLGVAASLAVVVPAQICGFAFALVTWPYSEEAFVIAIGIYSAGAIAGALVGAIGYQKGSSNRDTFILTFLATIPGLVAWFILAAIFVSLLQSNRQPYQRTLLDTFAARVFYSVVFVTGVVGAGWFLIKKNAGLNN